MSAREEPIHGIPSLPDSALDTAHWKLCNQGEWKVDNVTLGPARIVPGTTAHFVIESVDRDTGGVSAGSIEMIVRLSGIPIYARTDDLCSKTTCPSGSRPRVVSVLGNGMEMNGDVKKMRSCIASAAFQEVLGSFAYCCGLSKGMLSFSFVCYCAL